MSTIQSKRLRVKAALSDLTIWRAKPDKKPYSLNDGDGLSLLVEPNTSKGWRFRYTLNGRARGTFNFDIASNLVNLDVE
ncbi:Arm DNA-binding domain-containing protein [Methylophilus glucosoxydans]|uniref:Arm DNA-binding domain-containing protein n=1 Tax=Methylophilus glucosoxydans TaxID=752553 RepID=A0ABW3GJ38_9PROT